MKSIFKASYILFAIFSSCSSDDFNNTQRYFLTDRNVYAIGDTIQVKALIKPIGESKVIRIYENYKNIEVSFALMNDDLKMHNAFWSVKKGNNLPKSKIKKIEISEELPFQMEFQVLITEKADSIYLNILQLNYYASFPKETLLLQNSRLRIHGFCSPIDPPFAASLEDFFEVKDIRIIEKAE